MYPLLICHIITGMPNRRKPRVLPRHPVITVIPAQETPAADSKAADFRHILFSHWRFLLIILGLAALFIYLFKDLPSPTQLSTTAYPVSTQIFDRNGILLYEIYADQNRTPVKLADLPPYIKQATIAIEDKDFYNHRGIDPRGLLRSFFNTFFRQEVQGGSTITQQLVKNALLTPERTLRRKIREFVLTVAVETLYPKDRILEMYLNQIPYGGTSYGIESAAETYFGKHAKDITLPEAAYLAGLPQAPTQYSQFGPHPELGLAREADVLRQMVVGKYITTDEAAVAVKVPLHFAAQAGFIKAPHFSLWIREQLAEKYGEQMIEQGGLRVDTTLDSTIQDYAQQTVHDEVAKLKSAKVSNGASLVVRPGTGEILAMVGSEDFFDASNSGNVNVTMALRQPGSAIKPINYSLGLLHHLITPSTPFIDAPTCFLVTGQPPYCPVNYDGQFHGIVQTRFALGNSFNIPAVKMLYLNGIQDFIATASAMGITTFTNPSNYGLSLTLGGGEVKMTDMATAFGVLANGGIRQDLMAITKVTTYNGKTLEENRFRQGPRVLPMDVAYLVSHILLDNGARAMEFGPASYLVVANHPEVSVKTGTTNDKRDNWTFGYNQDVLVATWVGNDDNSPMGAVASGITGASPIWNKIMAFSLKHPVQAALTDAPPPPTKERQAWPIMPPSVVGREVCVTSGALPPNPDGPDKGCQTRFEYFQADNLPKNPDVVHRQVPIYKDTHQPVGPDESPSPDQVVIEDHPFIQDPTGVYQCLDCPGASKSAVLRYPPPLPQPTPSL
jgi:penicillin-binding protein 1C